MNDIVQSTATQEFVASGRDVEAAEAVGKGWVGKIAKEKIGAMFVKVAGSSLPSEQKAIRFVQDTQQFTDQLRDTLKSPTYAIPLEALEGVVTRVVVQGIKDAVDKHGGLKEAAGGITDMGSTAVGYEGRNAEGTGVTTISGAGGSSGGRAVADSQTALLTALFDRFSPKGGMGTMSR